MSFLGRFLVEQGAVSQAQLEEGLRYQGENNRRIGEVAMDRGVLTAEQVLAIRDRQQEDHRLFGDIAVGDRRMSRRTLDELLFFQKVHHVYLGEALLLLGHLDRDRYRELMGRYGVLREQGRVELRYLQEYFAENRVAELFFTALSRAVGRLSGQALQPAGIGQVFDWPRGRETAVITGRVLGCRELAAAVGLDAALAARLAGEPGGADVFETTLRYFGDMLPDAGLRLAEARLDRPGRFGHPPEQCLFVRGLTPHGEAAVVFRMGEDAV
ncbi:MAG: hypothetical protein ACP59X_20440 [Solidesulfovibrio sp. DCME]|uniref:hypothetical protein n=1 Tax=Solidesulfovibrio sp. DCME TaxID=3447380 RepID=UPI003D0E3E9F